MSRIAYKFHQLSHRAIIILLLAMLAFSAVLTTPAQAARLTTFSIGLGDSKPSTATNLGFSFITATLISGDTTASDDDGKIIIRFPAPSGTDPFTISGSTVAGDVTLTTGFTNITVNSLTLSDSDSDSTNDTITLGLNQTNGGSAVNIAASTTLVFSLRNDRITTPAKSAAAGTADLYDLSIASRDNGGSADVDTGATRVAVQDVQSVSATVNTTLSFTIAGVSSGGSCNGSRTADVTTTTSTIPFGTLAPNTAKEACHTLTIATNAPSGYNMYVVQSQNLTSGSDDIDQFKDGSRIDDGDSDTTWASPAVSAQNEATHGHLGYNSSDTGVLASTAFAGIPTGPAAGTAPVVDGLACDGSAATTGDTCTVEFKVEISALQPSGTYTSEVQYILVPVY